MKNALAIIGAIALAMGLTGIKPNISSSEPRGLWRMTNEPLKKGTFVLLANPMKEIAAGPGDVVKGYRLKEHEYWLKGNGPKSWDSTIYGPMPESLIISTMEPLLTPSWLQ